MKRISKICKLLITWKKLQSEIVRIKVGDPVKMKRIFLNFLNWLTFNIEKINKSGYHKWLIPKSWIVMLYLDMADIFPKGEKHKTVVGISVLISWYVVKLVFLAWNFFHTSVIKNNEHTVNPIINNHSKTLKNLFCEKIVILKINQIYFNNH